MNGRDSSLDFFLQARARRPRPLPSHSFASFSLAALAPLVSRLPLPRSRISSTRRSPRPRPRPPALAARSGAARPRPTLSTPRTAMNTAPPRSTSLRQGCRRISRVSAFLLKLWRLERGRFERKTNSPLNLDLDLRLFFPLLPLPPHQPNRSGPGFSLTFSLGNCSLAVNPGSFVSSFDFAETRTKSKNEKKVSVHRNGKEKLILFCCCPPLPPPPSTLLSFPTNSPRRQLRWPLRSL